MITLGNSVSITLFAELCHPWSRWLLIGPTPPKEFSQQCGNRFQTLWHTCYPSQPQSSIVIWVTSYRQQQQHEKHRPHHTSTPTCPQFSRVHWMGSTSQPAGLCLCSLNTWPVAQQFPSACIYIFRFFKSNATAALQLLPFLCLPLLVVLLVLLLLVNWIKANLHCPFRFLVHSLL